MLSSGCLAQDIESGVDGDAVHPIAKWSPRLKTRQLDPGPDKGFLGRILSDLSIAAQAVDHLDHAIVIAVDQLTEGVAVAFFGLDDQVIFNFRNLLKHDATSFSKPSRYITYPACIIFGISAVEIKKR